MGRVRMDDIQRKRAADERRHKQRQHLSMVLRYHLVMKAMKDADLAAEAEVSSTTLYKAKRGDVDGLSFKNACNLFQAAGGTASDWLIICGFDPKKEGIKQ